MNMMSFGSHGNNICQAFFALRADDLEQLHCPTMGLEMLDLQEALEIFQLQRLYSTELTAVIQPGALLSSYIPSKDPTLTTKEQ